MTWNLHGIPDLQANHLAENKSLSSLLYVSTTSEQPMDKSPVQPSHRYSHHTVRCICKNRKSQEGQTQAEPHGRKDINHKRYPGNLGKQLNNPVIECGGEELKTVTLSKMSYNRMKYKRKPSRMVHTYNACIQYLKKKFGVRGAVQARIPYTWN